MHSSVSSSEVPRRREIPVRRHCGHQRRGIGRSRFDDRVAKRRAGGQRVRRSDAQVHGEIAKAPHCQCGLGSSHYPDRPISSATRASAIPNSDSASVPTSDCNFVARSSIARDSAISPANCADSARPHSNTPRLIRSSRAVSNASPVSRQVCAWSKRRCLACSRPRYPRN